MARRVVGVQASACLPQPEGCTPADSSNQPQYSSINVTRRLAFVLSLIVLLPLAFVMWWGWRFARHESEMVQQQFRGLLADKLRDTDQTIVRYFQRSERRFLQVTELPTHEPSHLRDIVRSQPRLSQLFVLEPDGELLHPPPDGPLNQSEQEFLQRAGPFLLDKDLIRAASPSTIGASNGDAPPGKVREEPERSGYRVRVSSDSASTHGWHVWYWGRGLNLIFWRRADTGHVVGIELDRARWLADLIAELPSTAAIDELPASKSRICLVDSNANLVYQWGDFEPTADASPTAEIPLNAPLSSWRLKYFVADESLSAFSGRSAYFSLLIGLAALAIALIGLAIYLYRESSRELREVATRVNFVNQVSHELKTPLTNIRMYADLLEMDLESAEAGRNGKPQERLKVIIAESQRLSRLIGNVLTFARQQRGQVTLKPKTGHMDHVIQAVIHQFEPTMDQKGIEVRFRGEAQEPAEFDIDAVEQILVNLFNNVEKYAAGGKRMDVSSVQDGDHTTIRVSDRGAGIPENQRDRVFQPFYRASNRLEGAAGAGIGLSIARSLARLHGGDVVLLHMDIGATFRVDLHTPRPDSRDST